MKNEALERFTTLFKKRNEIRTQNAHVFDEFDKVYNQMKDAELDLKDEVIRLGHDLQNGTVIAKFINGNKDGSIRPRAQVEFIRD